MASQVGAMRKPRSGPRSGEQTKVSAQDLAVFEAENFNPDAFMQSRFRSANEEGIRSLCQKLLELKKLSTEEMRRSVYANYGAFIRTSREISDLENELSAMKKLLTTQATLTHTLNELEVPFQETQYSKDSNTEADGMGDSELEKHAQSLPDIIDVHLIERNVEAALSCLDEGNEFVIEGLSSRNSSNVAIATSFKNALLERKILLADQLTQAAKQPCIRNAELRSVISALNRLGAGVDAHNLLLSSHHERLQSSIRSLRPINSSYGAVYTTSLSQLVFSTIARASRDSTMIFQEEHAYGSALLSWAQTETENFATLLKKYVLSSSMALGSFHAVVEAVAIALGHCSLLEAEGLALNPALLKLLKPSVEQALAANIKRIKDSLSVFVAADDWTLGNAPTSTGFGSHEFNMYSNASLTPNLKLTTSAHRFNIMVQDFMEDMAPLTSMHLAATTLDAVSSLFEAYVSMLIRAMPASDSDEVETALINRAETEAQQLALLGNAAALADELIPRASLKLIPPQKDEPQRRSDKQAGGIGRPEQKELRRCLQRTLDNLRNEFCQQQALNLIYAEDGEPQLNAEVYLRLDDKNENSWHENPMPSIFFQKLFEKVSMLQEVGTDIMIGRGRLVTILLMRCTEAIVLWLCDYQEFWEEMEGGPTPLGPNGLQQLMLDMQFVNQMAVQGHYGSRRMRQAISDSISRAIGAFEASDIDLDSILPEDSWFITVAKDALRKLSISSKEPLSPTSTHSTLSM